MFNFTKYRNQENYRNFIVKLSFHYYTLINISIPSVFLKKNNSWPYKGLIINGAIIGIINSSILSPFG